MGRQDPTRNEKYVIRETIKILQFRRYSIGYSCPTNPSEKNHDTTIDDISKNLKKILARPTREDRAMILSDPLSKQNNNFYVPRLR